jgi:hypothetical protein
MDQAGVCLGSTKLGISAFGAGAAPAEIQIDHPTTPPPPRSHVVLARGQPVQVQPALSRFRNRRGTRSFLDFRSC